MTASDAGTKSLPPIVTEIVERLVKETEQETRPRAGTYDLP